MIEWEQKNIQANGNKKIYNCVIKLLYKNNQINIININNMVLFTMAIS